MCVFRCFKLGSPQHNKTKHRAVYVWLICFGKVLLGFVCQVISRLHSCCSFLLAFPRSKLTLSCARSSFLVCFSALQVDTVLFQMGRFCWFCYLLSFLVCFSALQLDTVLCQVVATASISCCFSALQVDSVLTFCFLSVSWTSSCLLSVQSKLAIAQLVEHLTVESLQTSDGPWLDSGWPDFLFGSLCLAHPTAFFSYRLFCAPS